MIPAHTKHQLDEYVKNQMPPGDFVKAVLANDLTEAVVRADDINLHNLKDIVLYVYNDLPSYCWGSFEIVSLFLSLRKICPNCEKWQDTCAGVESTNEIWGKCNDFRAIKR